MFYFSFFFQYTTTSPPPPINGFFHQLMFLENLPTYCAGSLSTTFQSVPYKVLFTHRNSFTHPNTHTYSRIYTHSFSLNNWHAFALSLVWVVACFIFLFNFFFFSLFQQFLCYVELLACYLSCIVFLHILKIEVWEVSVFKIVKYYKNSFEFWKLMTYSAQNHMLRFD